MKLISLTVVALAATTAMTQTDSHRVQGQTYINLAQSGRRFQMFVSPFRRMHTYLVDTAYGTVHMIAERPASETSPSPYTIWQKLDVQDPPRVSAQTASIGRFVINFDAVNSETIYLLDTTGGDTWVWRNDENISKPWFCTISGGPSVPVYPVTPPTPPTKIKP